VSLSFSGSWTDALAVAAWDFCSFSKAPSRTFLTDEEPLPEPACLPRSPDSTGLKAPNCSLCVNTKQTHHYQINKVQHKLTATKTFNESKLGLLHWAMLHKSFPDWIFIHLNLNLNFLFTVQRFVKIMFLETRE
jgi:hypothetical protein